MDSSNKTLGYEPIITKGERKMRKFITIIMIFMLLFTAVPMTYAADPTAGEQLKEMGLLAGDQYGNLNEGQNLTRTEMMVILARMLGEYDQAFAWSKPSTFADRNNHWGERYVAYGQYRGWTAGIGNNRFGYEQFHTVQEASVFMLKALGYTAPSDFTWTTAYSKAKSLGLFEGLNLSETSNILRGNLFKVMLKTLYTKMEDQNFTLGEKLNVLEPEELPFEVKSITATNLKEIEIVFTKPVDESTMSSSDFVISNRTVTPELISDGSTVRLTLSSALSNDTSYKITISGLRSEDDTSFSKTTISFRTDDDDQPTIESVRLLGPQFVELTFSEPIKTVGTVQVYPSSSSTLYTSAASFEGTGSRVIIAELSKAPAENTSYTYKVRTFKDYAGYSNTSYDVKLTYRQSNFDPTATIRKATEGYVYVEFSKTVSGLTKEHFYHTSASNVPLAIYADAAMTDLITISESTKQVYVKFAERDGDVVNGNPLSAGSRTIYILEENASGGVITDEYDNAFMGGSYTTTVTVDATKPSVSKLTIASSNQSLVKLTLEFSESVSFDEDNIDVTYADSGETPIDGLVIDVDGSGKSYTVELEGVDLTGTSIRVNLSDITDLALTPNILTSYSKDLNVADTYPPTIVEIEQDSVEKEVYITFSEPVSSTALSKSSYEINGIRVQNDPEFYIDNYAVVLRLTDDEFAESQESTGRIRILRVQDLSGNTIVSTTINFDTILDLAD